MAHTYEGLQKKTIDELRTIAKDIQHDAVKGYTQMNKEHLLPAICQALGIETHAHHHAEGINKGAIKATMRKLRAERAQAIADGDAARLKQIRRRYHDLNHAIRGHTV